MAEPEQVAAVEELLNRAFGPMFAVAAPVQGPNSIRFWAPFLVEAVRKDMVAEIAAWLRDAPPHDHEHLDEAYAAAIEKRFS